ncbi:MAG: type II toxin-antitoxin system Phd/YefM family antitoxin [Ancrocorticia sp.]|uniref:type II toxin-antitoxin system Phd/YefM family antitoxin n=1 Tax=Ancrocorticia sp. TaxID=2593684 RepID=UPI003F92C2D1
MSTISASQARQTLPAQLDRVEAGEEVAISRHGRVIAVLVSPQSLRMARAKDAWDRADRVGELLSQGSARSLPLPSITEERAEELSREIRTGRTAR